ncbi:MAG: glycosyltransferase family 2 protein [Nitrospirales bacterium]
MPEDFQRQKVSAVIIAFNDAPNIRRCLESVKWADEIIVLDSHSTDGTTEICQEYTPKVFQETFSGFGRLRNLAVAKATNDWILSVDTDEWATDEIKQEIQGILKSGPSAHAYFVPRRNYFLGRRIRFCGWYPDYRQPQFFHRGHMRYREDLVHESFDLEGKVGYFKSNVEQIPFRNIDHFLRKMDRYSALRAEAMHGEGRLFSRHQLITHPLFTFLKMYVGRLGFLDGKPGLILSILYAYYTFVKYAKLWEIQKPVSTAGVS